MEFGHKPLLSWSIATAVSGIFGLRWIGYRTRIGFTVEHKDREEELVSLRTAGFQVFDGAVGGFQTGPTEDFGL